VKDDRDLLAAIGEVAVEAAALEYYLGHLVARRRGWDADQADQLAGAPGRVRNHVKKLTELEPSWVELARLFRDFESVSRDRNVIIHSVMSTWKDPDSSKLKRELWSPREGVSIEYPTVNSIEELAFDISRCSRRAVGLFADADGRFDRQGEPT
jgi:hypothetical protein